MPAFDDLLSTHWQCAKTLDLIGYDRTQIA